MWSQCRHEVDFALSATSPLILPGLLRPPIGLFDLAVWQSGSGAFRAPA
jgi:hypothetical protein